ncbi:MAG: hypothetical protein K1X57_03990 [Gemmataceae bacterium]|nr:hypothetical protein [Gemmataceae bacterium]
MKTLRIAAWLSASFLTAGLATAADPPAAPIASPGRLPAATDSPVQAIITQPAPMTSCDMSACAPARGFLESDRAFDNFIGPITNPVLSKDPRSLTEARMLFINDVMPGNHPLTGGDFQVYAMQVRLALTERLTLIAD